MKLFFISALPGWNWKSHRHKSLACAVSRVLLQIAGEEKQRHQGTLITDSAPCSEVSYSRFLRLSTKVNPQRQGTMEAQHAALSCQSIWMQQQSAFPTAIHLNRKAQAAGFRDPGRRHSRVPSPLLCCCWNKLFIIFLTALHPSRAILQPLASTEIIYICLIHVSFCDCTFILRSSFLSMVFAASPILSPASFC